MIRLARAILWTVVSGILGAVVVLLTVGVLYLDSQPDLHVWHTAHLKEEFTAKSDVHDFAGYLALEERLFQELDRRVYDRVDDADKSAVNRYVRGSLSDPSRWERNWNRSFELPATAPRAGVLLLHGLSDSPYSLRRIGETLHANGAWVTGLRIPGHGTAPSGLVWVEWQDMAAAVRLAARHVRERIGDAPLYVVGYSNGGGLTVHYALEALADPALPLPDGIVLISPEIGVTPAAGYASWQAQLGKLLGLQKLAWSSVGPEFDPYKYVSFAVNGGTIAYDVTSEIQQKLDAAAAAGTLARFPPTIAFQSAVDATVSVPALVSNLMYELPAERGHELVLFDLNRRLEVEHLLVKDPRDELEKLRVTSTLPFALSVLTNESEDSPRIALRHTPAGSTERSITPTDLEWPPAIFSLSHLALPFAPDDVLYGLEARKGADVVQLGALALRGERGVLRITPDEMLRLHSNPFYPYLERRVLERLGMITPPSTPLSWPPPPVPPAPSRSSG
jgi:alpha-beta hydrolase superfamily lysophospholipase